MALPLSPVDIRQGVQNIIQSAERGVPSDQIQADPRIRQAFSQTIAGERAPLFEQANFTIPQSIIDKFVNPQRARRDIPIESLVFRQQQQQPVIQQPVQQFIPIQRPEEEERFPEEQQQEFFELLRSVEEQVPGREPVVANITSEKIRRSRRAPAFQTDQFNSGIIENVIRSNLAAGDIIDNNMLSATVQNVLAIGVAQALESNDPERNLLGVFTTLAEALLDIGPDVNDHATVARLIDEAGFNLISKQGLEDLTFRPSTVPDDIQAITDLFGPGLANVTSKNIPIGEIKQIALNFNEELRKSLETPLGTVFGFRSIVAWIDENVQNPTLKAALRSQARAFEVESIRAQSATRPNVPPELVPVAEGRGVLLSRDIGINISNELQLHINEVRAEPDGANRNRQLIQLVDNSNRIVRDLRITANRNGVFVIPTISKLDDEGRRKTPIQLLTELTELAAELPSPRSEFTWLPTKSEGMPINKAEIVQNIVETFSKQGKRSKAARKSIIHPSKLSEFGKVTVLTMKSEEGDNELEIVIPGNSSMEDILMIVNALMQEDGTLFDVDGVVLLQITRGVTTMAEILTAILKEQKAMLGMQFRLAYKPKSPVGGSYLGGSLSQLIKKPLFRGHIPPSGIPQIAPHMDILQIPIHEMYNPIGGTLHLPGDKGVDESTPFHIQITPESENRLNAARFGEDRVLPRGGNIFGDIISGIGSVVSAPFQIVGSLLGGQLPDNITRELERDALRPIAARG